MKEYMKNQYADEVTCPYCKEQFTDSWELEIPQEDWTEYECDDCEKTFLANREVSVTYSTKCIDSEHKWNEGYKMDSGSRCQECETCGEYKFTRKELLDKE